MNDNAKKWVEALRSGEYQQARDALREGDSFCCLGVACDIYSRETGTSWDGEQFLNSSTWLPPSVREWLGLTGHLGGYTQSSDFTTLAAQNDIGLGFRAIADIIESEPNGLFR